MKFLFLSLVFMSGCGLFAVKEDKGLDLKVYYSRPDLQGIVRQQENELVPYDKTKGYLCMTQRDFDALLNLCFAGSGK